MPEEEITTGGGFRSATNFRDPVTRIAGSALEFGIVPVSGVNVIIDASRSLPRMSGELPEELMDIESEIFGGDEDEEGPIEETEPVETERITVFRLGGETYGAPVMAIRQIVETSELTRVPRTADAIDGVIDLRGDITAVINPWEHLVIDGEPNDWANQLVAVFTTPPDEQPIGIRIDQIIGVQEFPVDDIDRDVDRSDPGPNAGNPIVEGMVERTDDDGDIVERIALIDTHAIIAASSHHPHVTPGGAG